jgi:hypothetical protein
MLVIGRGLHQVADGPFTSIEAVMELREEGLIILEKGRCTIPDLSRVEEAANV